MIEPFTCDLLSGRIVFGAGTLDRIRDEIEALGCSRILVIAGGSNGPGGERVASLLGGLAVGTHATVRQHVPEDLAAQVVDTARSVRADGVVSLGGGSTIGLGKVVAVTAGVPLVAVPTTYAGSEMTPIYGITKERTKVTRRDPAALPGLVTYDAELTLGLPGRVTATSGLNALAHCMEAIAGPVAIPPAALDALEAAHILPDALRACVSEPTDVRARSDAQYGAFLAGRALALAGTGLQHRLAHVLGGRFGLVHADAHAVLLPHVAAVHERDEPTAMARFAEALGAGEAGSAAEALHRLAVDVDAPRSLADLGMPREGIGEVAGELGDSYDSDVIRALLGSAYRPMLVDERKGGTS